uniref:Helitron helicase-like domain-containing protein n=1 Tax=Lactuca sativa TaxID=4236 RepID=A0A9R1X600_LACSA|nr:hypothetical protein LSAT_V11C600327840 [Lactuca sativa]
MIVQNYHSIGSLLPEQGFKPKFSQLYIYDTDNEIANRRTCFGGENQRSTSNSSVLDNDIIQDLKLMLDSNDVLVQSYRMVRDCFHENPHVDIKLKIIGRRDQDGRTYNLSSASEVAALTVGDIGDSIDNKDIIVQTSTVNYINHTFFFSIHYCFHMVMMVIGLTHHIEVLHLQATTSGPTFLIQQDLQNKDISNVRQPVILPSSFTGGAHYLMQNYLDFGYPDFFITFTCNPKWPEVKKFLHNTSPHLEDRPDILCRLFKIKLDGFIKNIQENKIFGIWSIQLNFKREVCQIVIFVYLCMLTPSGLLLNILIQLFPAEIPNINEDPEFDMNCPCMVDKQCSKKFPKQFCNHSSVDVNGYLLYMRRKNGYFFVKSGVKLDYINGSSIKYLFKYINKGPNKATIVVDINTVSHQEKRLPFPLPDQQQTMILTMFLNNLQLQLLCSHLGWNVIKFVWKLNDRLWKPRKIGRSIERIHSVSPKLGKVYFLRILLNKMKGPKSFEEICTVNGEEFPTFRDACYALGLLDDDKEYVDAIKEASHSGTR